MLIATILTSCQDVLPYVSMDDEAFMFSHTYTDTYGIAEGAAGVYVMYGKYPSAKHALIAGHCVRYFAPGHPLDSGPYEARFCIRDAITKFPELKSKKADAAAKKQIMERTVQLGDGPKMLMPLE